MSNPEASEQRTYKWSRWLPLSFCGGFAVKDSGIQLENGELKITTGSLLIKIKNVWILGC